MLFHLPGLPGAALILALGLLGWSLPAAAHAQSATPTVNLALEEVATGLTSPLLLISAPGDNTTRFIADQIGTIYVLDGDEFVAEPFLDLRDAMVPLDEGFDERGLLGLAFHPDYAENGRFYVSYTAPLRPEAPAHWNYTRRISEFTVDAEDPRRANPDSERVLMEIDWPSRKHNGGALAFGPDGYLYIGVGDSGGAHGVGLEVRWEAFEMPASSVAWDTFAQDVESLYGSILRIDVDRGYPDYGIPPSNPFVGRPGLDEIYAWGFRNPYRLSFDKRALDAGGQPAMFVTAVAETLWEAIYLVDQPGNYGWALKEGTHCFDRQQPYTPPQECPSIDAYGYPILDPIIQYANMSIEREEAATIAAEAGPGLGSAVTGGYIYRGEAFPELQGKFIFADWSRDPMSASGQILMATPPSRYGELWDIVQIHQLEARALSMGEDADGELYVLTSTEIGPTGNTGVVYKLVPAGDAVDTDADEAPATTN